MPKSIKGSSRKTPAPPPPPPVISQKSSSSLKPSAAGAARPTSPSSSPHSSPSSPGFPTIESSQSSREADLAREYETSTTPIFGSVNTSGFRGKFRSGRDKERASPIPEESIDERMRKSNSRTPAPREGFFGSSRSKSSAMLSSSTGSTRRPSGNGRLDSERSPTPDEGSSVDPEALREGRRGSMIGKLGKKAKSVLPKRTAKEPTISEGSRNLGVRPSVSASSLRSNGNGQTRYDESTSASEQETEEDEDDDRTLNGRAYNGASNLPSPAKEAFQLPLMSPTDAAPSIRDTHPGINGSGTSRPKSVPARTSSSEAVVPMQSQVNMPTVRRSNKIMQLSPEDLKPTKPSVIAHSMPRIPTTSAKPPVNSNPPNPHTSKEPPNLGIDKSHTAPKAVATLTNNGTKAVRPSASSATLDGSRARAISQPQANADRPHAPRSTSAIKGNSSLGAAQASPLKAITSNRPRAARTYEPPVPDIEQAPKLDPAPPNGMYWSKAQSFGEMPSAMRAHNTTLVGNNIYAFGGCDSAQCFNDLYVFDADCMCWSKPAVGGDIPPPLRATTSTAVGKKIVIFGGGDGPSYYNDIYVLDALNCRYTKAVVHGTAIPTKRRAHAACLYKNGIYVFGGGDGIRALNDVWRLDVSDFNKLSWRLMSPPTSSKSSTSIDGRLGSLRPIARGYHSANMVGSKMIVFGGSDGQDCFRDLWIFDVDTLVWKSVDIKVSYPRLSHSATIVGSYLFVLGGHDGTEYSNEVLLLNLVTMHWDRRKVYGAKPTGRGYHGAILHDSRLYMIGGFDGNNVFDDTYMLELGISAYYSQISHFTIDV
ncbi:MAG: hypothetical protein M1824_004659 [Vezdaea acicularis]|nr:MAG: hypothetical protein M1824_004659 [Vezdaea acicularis]